jgi:regulator of replication initiation timing
MTDKDFEQFKADVRGLIDDTNRLWAENERLREALTTIAGPPERDPDLPPIYQPRWSVEQCRYIARAALQPKEGCDG